MNMYFFFSRLVIALPKLFLIFANTKFIVTSKIKRLNVGGIHFNYSIANVR